MTPVDPEHLWLYDHRVGINHSFRRITFLLFEEDDVDSRGYAIVLRVVATWNYAACVSDTGHRIYF